MCGPVGFTYDGVTGTQVKEKASGQGGADSRQASREAGRVRREGINGRIATASANDQPVRDGGGETIACGKVATHVTRSGLGRATGQKLDLQARVTPPPPPGRPRKAHGLEVPERGARLGHEGDQMDAWSGGRLGERSLSCRLMGAHAPHGPQTLHPQAKRSGAKRKSAAANPRRQEA